MTLLDLLAPIAPQTLGFLALGVLMATYQIRTPRKGLALQSISSLLYAAHYWLLGSAVAGVMMVAAAGRNLAGGIAPARVALLIVSAYTALSWGITAALYSEPSDIIPPIATTVHGVAMLLRDHPLFYRLGNLLSQSIWGVFFFFVDSYAGYLQLLILNGSIVIALVRFHFLPWLRSTRSAGTQPEQS